jgi:tetratricopeptide (TPR) repeat protein
MIKSKRNKFGLILLWLVFLAFAIAFHVLYSLRLSTYHFSSIRFYKHLSAGNDALREHDYVKAETYFNAALNEAEKESSENKYIDDALFKLGVTYLLFEKFDEAEAAFLRQLAVAEKIYGPESEEAERDRQMIKKIHEWAQQKND